MSIRVATEQNLAVRNFSSIIATTLAPQITLVQVCDSSYNVLDDTSVSTSGGYIKITGSGFQNGCVAYVAGSAAIVTIFVSTNVLNCQVGPESANSQLVYVRNPDGSTAIFIQGIPFSGVPNWTTGATLTNQNTNAVFSIQLTATSDSAITYTLQAGSTLPPGTTLTSAGVFSGTVTGLSVETTYSFVVVATDAEFQDTGRTFTVTFVVGDPYFYLTTLLLPGNGSNNATNNTFVDSSNNAFTITRNGNATQGTFSPFSQTGWSNYFDGTQGTCLKFGSNSNLALGSGNFTVEFWLYLNAAASGGFTTYLDYRTNGFNSANIPLIVDYNNNGKMTFAVGTGGGFTQILESSGTVPLNSWTHVALIRNGSTVTLYFNGTSVGSGSSSANFGIETLNLNNPQTSGNYNGNYYISNFRIVKGTAVYTGNFTPPTAPITAIANTALLTCQNNRFVDNSTNNFTLTTSGTPSIQAFSPFAPTAAYNASTVGGSAYFDGTGDYLNTPATGQFAPTGDFTVAWWYYPVTLQVTAMVANYTGNNATDWSFETNSAGDLLVYLNGATVRITGSAALKLNQWHYIVVSRSGTTVTAYVNGSQVGSTFTLAGTFGTATKTIRIGAGSAGTNNMFGYCSGVHLIDGTALTGTVPTTPPSVQAGTSLLLNFTNASITDATAKNVIETVGDAKISTVQSKWGGSSMFFDGTVDRLFIPNAPTDNLILSGDFTVEAWVRPTSLTGLFAVFNLGDYAGTNGSLFYITNTGRIAVFSSNGQTTLGTSITVAINTWYHVAWTRSGSTLRQFVNGTQDGSGTTSNIFKGIGVIGADFYNSTYSNFSTGYIQDLRVTRGYARYTANFTAPTSAFLLQ